MPKVVVSNQSKLPAKDAFQKIRKMLENDKELRALDSGYTCQFNDTAMSGTAKGSKFEANMSVKDKGGAGSLVEIEVSLPMLLTPMKGIVQSTLQKKIDAALA